MIVDTNHAGERINPPRLWYCLFSRPFRKGSVASLSPESILLEWILSNSSCLDNAILSFPFFVDNRANKMSQVCHVQMIIEERRELQSPAVTKKKLTLPFHYESWLTRARVLAGHSESKSLLTLKTQSKVPRICVTLFCSWIKSDKIMSLAGECAFMGFKCPKGASLADVHLWMPRGIAVDRFGCGSFYTSLKFFTSVYTWEI